MQRYRNESGDALANAQRNLDGRTHYVDPATLRFHYARVNRARAAFDGMLFYIIESHATDMHNKGREHRGVVFNIFGRVVYHPELGAGFRSIAQAEKAMWVFLNEFDVVAHTAKAIDETERYHAQEMKRMREDLAKWAADRKAHGWTTVQS